MDADLGVDVRSTELFAGVSANCDCFSGGVTDCGLCELVGVKLLLLLVLLLLLLLWILDVVDNETGGGGGGGGLLFGLVKGGVSFLGERDELPFAAPGLVVPAS